MVKITKMVKIGDGKHGNKFKVKRKRMVKLQKKDSGFIELDIIGINEKIKYNLIELNIFEDIAKNNINKVVLKDRFNFIEIYTYNDIMCITITELDRGGLYQKLVKGQIHTILIKKSELCNFILSNDKKISIVEVIEKPITGNVEITGKNIKSVLSNKKLKKQFIKQLLNLTNDYNSEKIYIGDDFVENSFSFCKYGKNGYRYNGGIILHTNSDGTKYYGIHT